MPQSACNPPVTVVITTFNRATMVAQAIASVQRQSFRNCKILVCDNASTDDTESVVRSLVADDDRIVYRRRPANLGAAKNIALGFREVETEFVAWLMDDDSWHEDHLAEGMERLLNDPGAVLYAAGTRMTRDGSSTDVHPWFRKERDADVILLPDRDFMAMLPHCPFLGSAVIFRRSTLEDVPSWPPNLPVLDWILWGLLAIRGRVIYNPSVRAVYQWHAGNDTYTSLTGRRCAALNGLARRLLARSAIEAGVLKNADILAFLENETDVSAVRMVALSLCGDGMPREIRKAAIRALVKRPELSAGGGKFMLLRIARLGGGFAFPWFDRLNQILGRAPASESWPEST